MLNPLWQGMGEFVFPTTPRAQFALRTALAIVVAALVALALHLENPFWSAMSAALIMNPSIGATIERGMMRVVGTVVGACLGLLLASISANSFFLFISFGFSIITAGAYLSLTTRHPFAYIFGTISAFLVMSSMVYTYNNPYFFMVYRIQEIVVGVIAGLAVSLLVFPTQAKNQLQTRLADIAQSLANLTELITAYYYRQSVDTPELKKLFNDINKNLIGCQELYKFSKMEFGNTVFATSLSKDLWRVEENIFKQLEAIYLNYRSDLHYPVLHLEEIPVKPLFENIAAELRLISNCLSTLDVTQPLNHTAQIFYQDFDKKFATFRDARKMLQFPVEESAAFYALSQNLAQLVITLNQMIQLCHEATSLDRRAKDQPDQPFFKLDRSKETIQYSIKAGLAIVLATLLWMASDWPAGIQGIVSAAIISFQKNIYDVQLRGELRFLGAILGGGIGLLALHLFPLTISGLLLILFIFDWIFAYFTFGNPKYSYAALQANIALSITLLHSSYQDLTIEPAVQRLAGVFIGIICTLIIYRVVWPVHPKQLLVDGIHRLAQQIATAFQKIAIAPYASSDEIDIDTTAINAKFIRNYELLESLRTYLNEDHPFIIKANAILDIQRHCATLIFSIAKGIDLTVANTVANTYQIKLTEILEKAANIMLPIATKKLKFFQTAQLIQAQQLQQTIDQELAHIRQQTQTLTQFQHSRTESTQFLYLFNNLRQLLGFYLELMHSETISTVAEIQQPGIL